MKRFFTATCLAAACAVGLAAQSGTSGTSSTSMQNPQGGRGGGPRTVTGCLRAGDTAGSFMLTDITMAGMGGGAAGTTTSGSSSTAGSSAADSSASGATGQGMRGQMPTSIMLNASSDVDLKAHVGHKIEVTGTMAGGRRGGNGGGDTTMGSGSTGSTSGSGSTTGSTSGSGSTAGSTSGSMSGGQGRGGRSMTVTSVRMISDSCS